MELRDILTINMFHSVLKSIAKIVNYKYILLSSEKYLLKTNSNQI